MRRTFVAIKIPLTEHLHRFIDEIQQALMKEIIKWVEKNNMHITLKFLGDTKEEDISEIDNNLAQICNEYSSTQLKLTGTGVFKNFRNPRVLWIGTAYNPKLDQLYKSIDAALIQYGFETEDKQFIPHLTLGRIKWINNFSAFKERVLEHKDIDFGEVQINEVLFLESTLTPQGPIYNPINTYKLKS